MVVKVNSLIRDILNKKSLFWEKIGYIQMMKLIRFASKNVPAYKDFLKRNKIEPGNIKNVAGFNLLPIINKKDYLRKYPLNEVTVGGRLNKPLVFTSTSGSTGEPFYFHRSFDLDWQTSVIHELFFLQGQYKKNEPVLVIICFGMGVWIGGLITYQAFHLLQERGYNVSIITPGINKEEIFKSLKNLGAEYKNIILVGYPPFIKDIIDDGLSQGVDWKKFRVRLLFAAESFVENFRDYVGSVSGVKNLFLDTMNIYGTADLGAIAFESPLSILVRRIALKKPKLFEKLFGNIKKTPTLAQYIPSFVSFSVDGNDLLVSGNNTIPLVKYSLGDHGGVYSFGELVGIFSREGVDIKKEAKRSGITKFWYELPFVYVYERDDFSTNIYGLQVYPEPIREALLKQPLHNYFTGKFVMETRFDRKQNQYILIHLEVRKSHNGSTPQAIRQATVNAIVEQLEIKNSEYRELHKFLGKRALPRLQLWPAEDPTYFKIGIKQKWVKK